MDDEPDSETRPKTASDMPVDLARERETFVRSFMRRGVELTEELLKENEALRRQNQRQHDEIARLRAQVASDDAVRDFMKAVETLESERRRLLEHSNELERSKETDSARFDQIESELNDLANLYIASFQLHASLSPRRVVRHLQDMLGQLVGAHAFSIFLLEEGSNRAVRLAHENMADGPTSIDVGEGPIGDACLTGISRISEGETQGTIDDPVAVVPLLVEGRPVGAIAIISLLEQKTGWASLDLELFKLIGAHAGTALIAANLYSDQGGPVPALSGLQENILKRGASLVPSPQTGE